MAYLTTGLIKNLKVNGLRPSSTLSARITNAGTVSTTTRISAFYWEGTIKHEYVLDLLTLAPGEVANPNYYSEFDEFEFQFITNTDSIEISAWGNDSTKKKSVTYNILPADILQMLREGAGGPTDAREAMIHGRLEQIFVLNSSRTTISVIDRKTNTCKGNVIVGAGPFGIGINLQTNRIYIANFSSDNVSVISGSTNAVITTIAVGTNPVGVAVNPSTNKIYVTNWGSHSISVIDGFTQVVIATVSVGASPEGIHVNPTTNRIYVTHHGSNKVSVLDGTTNQVIASIDIGI